jgi:hypothetical protein
MCTFERLGVKSAVGSRRFEDPVNTRMYREGTV